VTLDNGTDGRTDRQTDRVRRNMRPPPREEGSIITVQIHSWRYSGRLPEKANAHQCWPPFTITTVNNKYDDDDSHYDERLTCNCQIEGNKIKRNELCSIK